MASLELHDCTHVLNGLVVPKFVKQEVQDKLKDLSLRDDDVWIVTMIGKMIVVIGRISFLLKILNAWIKSIKIVLVELD